MATLNAQENHANEWKPFEGSSNWSGVVQNEDKNSVYLYVTKVGEQPVENTGVYLNGGVGEKLPISIGEDEILHFKPAVLSYAKIRLA